MGYREKASRGRERPVNGPDETRHQPPEVAGRWEFPGGKVEPGETDAQAACTPSAISRAATRANGLRPSSGGRLAASPHSNQARGSRRAAADGLTGLRSANAVDRAGSRPDRRRRWRR